MGYDRARCFSVIWSESRSMARVWVHHHVFEHRSNMRVVAKISGSPSRESRITFA